MKSALLFGLHMHQPTDNFDEVIERAVERCYDPLFSTFLRYPDFRFALHCSGWLMKRIKKRFPETFEKIRSLAKQGSIEFFGGGYYEPILPSIPSQDRSIQIEMLSEQIEKYFGAKPRGAWITERVWEDSLVTTFGKEKIEYAMVDDYHFLAAGFDLDALQGYYFTESEGERLALFPISKELRYAIPFAPVEEAIQKVRQKETAIIFDDAEKFGLWPHTYEWVYKRGWLERFIEAVLQEESIEPMHFHTFYDTLKPKGLAYIPNLSYYEMGEWSLKTEQIIQLEELKKHFPQELFQKVGVKFLRGGIWKNFFIKYEESNRLHKRMLEISTSGYKKRPLLKLQTNDVYWHGVFGGLYLPNLRDNAYRYLIRCENDRYSKASIEIADIDMDGYEEVKVVQKNFIYRFERACGGQLVELDDRQRRFNFQNTLTRREEFYHHVHECEKRKEAGISTIHTECKKIPPHISQVLHFDAYTKNSFIDHVTDDSLNLQTLYEGTFTRYATFCEACDLLQTEPLTFYKKNLIEGCDSEFIKSYTILDNTLLYRLTLHTGTDKTYRYALELNLHFADNKNVKIEEKKLEKGLKFEKMDYLHIYDPYTERRFVFATQNFCDILLVPLQTVSQNEEGFELTDQGITLVFHTPFANKIDFKLSMEIEHV